MGMSASKRLTPYQRIVRAAEKGRGVRLTVAEVFALSRDHAIYSRAEGDDEPAREIEDRKLEADWRKK